MQLAASASVIRDLSAFSRFFTRSFPVPALLEPHAAGIDVSDASVKWVVLSPYENALRVERFGEIALPPGAVQKGAVRDPDALVRALREAKDHLGSAPCAHAALPEEEAYVFEMHVPAGTPHDAALKMVEFEFEGRVPIPPSEAVYDIDTISLPGGESEQLGVSVFPRELAEAYADAFERAGITLLSLEIEARSIARAVSSAMEGEPITLLVDFGHKRTGFAVLKRGVPIFTSTVELGGAEIDRALAEKLSLSNADAIAFRNEHGLLPATGSAAAGLEVVTPVAAALADEIARYYHYWDTRRNEHGERMSPVGEVVLVGGSSNLRGLPNYIAGRVHAPTHCGNVWRNACDFDEYIPPITWRRSLGYATAIGLALRPYRS